MSVHQLVNCTTTQPLLLPQLRRDAGKSGTHGAAHLRAGERPTEELPLPLSIAKWGVATFIPRIAVWPQRAGSRPSPRGSALPVVGDGDLRMWCSWGAHRLALLEAATTVLVGR